MPNLSSDQVLELLRLVTGAATTSLSTTELNWEHLQAVLQHGTAGRILDRAVAQTLRRMSDMHILDVDYRQSLDDVRPVSSGGTFDFSCGSDSRINTTNFPDTPDRGVEQVCSDLLPLESGINTIDDVLRYIREQGMRPANVRELIAFQQLRTKHHERNLIVALGSSFENGVAYTAYTTQNFHKPIIGLVQVPTVFEQKKGIKFLAVLDPGSTIV